MLDVIEKLLILQDRDRKIARVKEQLAHIPAERRGLEAKLSGAQADLETAKTRVKQLESNRSALADAVDGPIRVKYERLFKQKGQNVVVGIPHGVCGGCHMQLSRATVVACQAHQEIVTCLSCGRILYCTPDMDLAAAE